MLALTSTLPLLLLTNSAFALPAPRQSNDGPISIADAMASLYSMYLQSQGVTKGSFYQLVGGETEIDFAGVGDDADMYGTNKAIYRTADLLPHMNPWNSTGSMMFSDQYRHFIQALKNATATAPTPAQATQLKDLSTNMTIACTEQMQAVTNDAYTQYKAEGGTAKVTDAVFIQFATQMYGNYSLTVQACHDAQNAVANLVSAPL